MIRVKMGVWVGDNDGQWRMVDEDEASQKHLLNFIGQMFVGLVSKRGEPSTEFTMLNEDFPALPGTITKSGW